MIARFRLPVNEDKAYELLLAAIIAEVQFRHRKFVYNEFIDDQLRQIAKWLTTSSPKFGMVLCGGCGNIITPIIDLLTKRYEAQLFTIVTTNLDPKDIRKRYGDRIADRLNEMMAKIVYRNPTYRMDEIQTDGMS